MKRTFLRPAAILCALFALIAPALAHAQSAVQQVGPVTPGHASVWYGNGQVADETQIPNWLSGELDNNFGSTPGEILCRATTEWEALTPGASGQYLISAGGTGCPAWTTTTPGGVPVPFTRAQIPTENIGAGQTVVVTGYRTANDLGQGAVYQSNNCASTGWDAIQDAGGNWFCLSPANLTSNPGWFGAPGNGGATLVTAADVAAHPEWRGSYGYATFTGTLSGTGNPGDPAILTVTCPCTGSIVAGQRVTGTGVTMKTVVSQVSGTAGAAGVYAVDSTQPNEASVGPIAMTSGDTWDYVGTNEADLYAFAAASTPGNVVWNSGTGNANLNRTLYVPNGSYGLNQQLYSAATDGTVQFASNAACWVWYGVPSVTMWYANSYSFMYVGTPCIRGGVRPQVGQAAPLWNLNHDSGATGNDTQQVTIVQPLIAPTLNGDGLAIATSGSLAQGSTIRLINPEFEGAVANYCLYVDGADAIADYVDGGDFQGCGKNAIQDSAASVFVNGTTFEDQNGIGTAGTLTASPQSNQFTLGGADVNATASGAGANSVASFSNIRSEGEVGAICVSAYCTTDKWQMVGVDYNVNAWFANYPFQRGYVTGGAIGTGVGGFIAVDDGSPASVGDGNGGWGVVGAGSTDCTINDPTQAWTTNQFVGMTLFFRFTGGFTDHQTASITGNTATSVTISPCFTTGTVVVGDTYHIGGQSGASAPSWSSAAAGNWMQPLVGSTGFSTVAGSDQVVYNAPTTISVGNYVVIWGADQILNASLAYPTALIGKVTAVCNDVSCGTLASFTASITSFTMTVTGAVSGTIWPGETLTGTGVTSGTKVTSQVSGTPGGAGVYFVSAQQTVGSTSITGALVSGYHMATLDREAAIDVGYGGGYYGAPIADDYMEWLALPTPSFYGQARLTGSGAPGFVQASVVDGSACLLRTDCDLGVSPTNLAGQTVTFSRDWAPRERTVYAQGNVSGTVDLTQAMSSANDVTLNMTGATTLDATALTTAGMARTVTLRITSGSTSQVATFGTDFASAGPLTTDGNPSSVYDVVFHTSGTTWNEVSRSGPNRSTGAGPFTTASAGCAYISAAPACSLPNQALGQTVTSISLAASGDIAHFTFPGVSDLELENIQTYGCSAASGSVTLQAWSGPGASGTALSSSATVTTFGSSTVVTLLSNNANYVAGDNVYVNVSSPNSGALTCNITAAVRQLQ